MYFAELSEFGESHQNPKAAWLSMLLGVLPIWYQTHVHSQ